LQFLFAGFALQCLQHQIVMPELTAGLVHQELDRLPLQAIDEVGKVLKSRAPQHTFVPIKQVLL
jgi:hypothetical protein